MGLKPRERRRSAGQGSRQKAVGVVRCSTSKQDIGAAAQRTELERWATEQGVELVGIFEDLGVSGAAPLRDRPGLAAALEAARAEGAGLLVAVKRDRFARHRHTIADVERAAARAGARLVTTDGLSTGADDEQEELLNGFSDLLAAMELRKIKARNKARAQRCKAEGRTHGGRLPFGMRIKRSGTVSARTGRPVELEPDPTEQKAVRRMKALRDEGLSYSKIAAALQAEGFKARGAKGWKAMTVSRVLARVGE